jgi:hypothetical protein
LNDYHILCTWGEGLRGDPLVYRYEYQALLESATILKTGPGCFGKRRLALFAAFCSVPAFPLKLAIWTSFRSDAAAGCPCHGVQKQFSRSSMVRARVVKMLAHQRRQLYEVQICLFTRIGVPDVQPFRYSQCVTVASCGFGVFTTPRRQRPRGHKSRIS